MARIRSFKPEAFIHEELNALEESHPILRPMLVFLGLMPQADKAGRFEWRPKRLKLGILPFVEFDLEASMDLLVSRGLLFHYEVEAKAFGCFPTWNRHQKPHHQEPESILPGPPNHFGESPKSFDPGGIGSPIPSRDTPKLFDHIEQPPSKSVGDSQSGFNREGEKEWEREGEEEGEGRSGEARPTSAACPEWIERELCDLGIQGPGCWELAEQLGVQGIQEALAKLRSKGKGSENAAGLLLRRGKELSAEGRSLLRQNLERARKLAPRALEDPRWARLPQGLQQDPEVQAAWCVWLAAEAAGSVAGPHDQLDATDVAYEAQGVLLDMLLLRHSGGEAIRRAVDETATEFVKILSPIRAKRVATMQVLFEIAQEVD